MANYDGKILTDDYLELYYESAKNITVGSGGELYVREGASITNTIVNADAYLQVCSHGKAYGTVINNGGSVVTTKADLLEGTVVNNGGELIFGGYYMKNTTINAGGLLIYDYGKESSGLTVNRGGILAFSGYDVTTLAGKNVFAGTVITKDGSISSNNYYGGDWEAAVNVTGEVIFAVEQRKTSDDAIIDDISIFRNGTYSITVSASQEEGRYRLAGNAGNFDKTLTVKDTSFKKLGSLNVGGSFSAKGYTYSLLLDQGTLVLNVAGGGAEPEEPGVVTGLKSTVSKYNISLSWDKSTVKNSSFEISINGAVIGSTKTNKYALKNFEVGNYQAQVRMLTADGATGNWSEAVSFSVEDVTAPKLGKVSAAIDGYTGTISWSGSDNVGITRYEVRCADQVKTVTGTSAEFDNLAVGKYNVEVIAYDAAGNASKAGKAKITVKDATPPEKVTGLVLPAADAKYKATLSWNPGVDNSGKVARYEIQLDDGKILKSSKTSLNVSKLSVGEHSYKVRAIDKDKNVGEWSDAVSFTVKDMTAPGNVSVKAKVEDNSLLLTWKTPKDNVGVTGYILKHGVNLEHTEVLTAGELTFQIDGIAKGGYQYQIVAVDAAGNESKAKSGKATIKTDLPAIDFNLVPEATPSLAFDSGLAAASGGFIDDPLAFCSYLKLEAALNLSTADWFGTNEAEKRPSALLAAVS